MYRRDRRRNSDRDRCPVKRGNREPFEILTDVVLALVTEYAQGRGLTEPETPLVIRSPVNPCEIACQTDVRGQLVDFAVDCNLARIRARIGASDSPSPLAVTIVVAPV